MCKLGGQSSIERRTKQWKLYWIRVREAGLLSLSQQHAGPGKACFLSAFTKRESRAPFHKPTFLLFTLVVQNTISWADSSSRCIEADFKKDVCQYGEPIASTTVMCLFLHRNSHISAVNTTDVTCLAPFLRGRFLSHCSGQARKRAIQVARACKP